MLFLWRGLGVRKHRLFNVLVGSLVNYSGHYRQHIGCRDRISVETAVISQSFTIASVPCTDRLIARQAFQRRFLLLFLFRRTRVLGVVLDVERSLGPLRLRDECHDLRPTATRPPTSRLENTPMKAP